jgi:pyruvate,water dikinase
MFSANPVTGNRDEVMINASWGLGESIVGGTVTPDTYVVRNADMATVSRRVAEKRRMTVMATDGTREVEVPRFLRMQPHWGRTTDGDGALGVALERRMGHPWTWSARITPASCFCCSVAPSQPSPSR